MVEIEFQNITVLDEWLSMEKASFKILVVTSVLADNKLAFRGKLKELCTEIGIGNSSENIRGIKAVLDKLSKEGCIKVLEDENIYTISLAEAAKKSKNVKSIKKVWYQLIKDTKAESSWDSLLKTFIYLYDLKSDKAVTYSEIGERVGLSPSTVGKCVRALKKLKFPEKNGYMVIRCDADSHKVGDTIVCNGMHYTLGISFE